MLRSVVSGGVIACHLCGIALKSYGIFEHGTAFSVSVHVMNGTKKHGSKVLIVGARDELRLRVLQTLEGNPELSQRQIAAELGVSLGGVNYVLKALIARGCVKANNFRESGAKVSYLYLLTPMGLAEKSALATAFLGRKLNEYEVLRQEIEALKIEVESKDCGTGFNNSLKGS